MSGLSGGERKRIRLLSGRRGREREGRFVAEGVRVVEELLAAGVSPELVVLSSSLGDTDRGTALGERLRRAGGAVREVTDAELRDLADTATTQGVLVVAETPRRELTALEPAEDSTLLVLDGVQDPGNLGTLARSAAAFGCQALVALSGTVDPWNPKAVRASAGALFRIPVVQPGLAELTSWLDRREYLMAAAEVAGEPVREAALPRRVALVLGNEGGGLSAPVAERCERSLAIPMVGGTESLNVAVAGSILLYELTRERA